MKHCRVLFILPLTLLIFSCGKDKPCPAPQERYYNIAEDVKADFPFTGLDTLVFIKNGKKEYTYYGTGIDSGYQAREIGMECIDEVHYSQYMYISFYSPDTSRNLNLYVDDFEGADEIHVNFFGDIGGIRNPLYADSTEIQGKIYYNVFKWSDVHVPTEYVLYTAKDGPIKMVSGLKNEVWERVR